MFSWQRGFVVFWQPTTTTTTHPFTRIDSQSQRTRFCVRVEQMEIMNWAEWAMSWWDTCRPFAADPLLFLYARFSFQSPVDTVFALQRDVVAAFLFFPFEYARPVCFASPWCEDIGWRDNEEEELKDVSDLCPSGLCSVKSGLAASDIQ